MNINNSKEKQLETCIVIATGLLVIWYFKRIDWLVYAAIAIGIIGAFIPFLSKWIHWAWYKLAEMMGFVMSKVMLSIVFYLILFPLAFFYRLFSKDAMQRKKKESYWTERSHQYSAKDLENIW